MGKTKKRKSGKSSNNKSQNINVLNNELKQALDYKRGRKAVSVCKLLFKNSAFKAEDYSELIVSAYEIRIRELLNKRELIQAEQMLESLLKSYPQLKDIFPIDLFIRIELSGGKIEILSKYNTDKNLTQKINDFILIHLYDIRLLTNLKKLPDNHSLKKDAVILLNAWEEIERDDKSLTAYSQMLKVINRHSPYRNWRMFIQALNAFYSGDDKVAIQCISRIDNNPPVSKLAASLSALISGKENEEFSVNTNKLSEKIYGYSVKNTLSIIDKMLDDECYTAAVHQMEELIKSKYFFKRKLLLKFLMAIFIKNVDDYIDIEDMSSIIRRYEDIENSFQHTLVPSNMDDAILWKKLLETKSHKYSEIEKALINRRIAYQLIKKVENDYNKNYDFYDRADEYTKPEKIDYYKDKIVKYWRESLECYHLQETYKLWYEQLKDLLPPSKYEKILEEWHINFPADKDALFYLVSSCRVRGVYKKAQTYCDILRQLIPGHPELVLLNNCLLIDTALYHFIKGRDEKCLKILDSLERPKEIFIKVLKELLYYTASSRLYPKKDVAQYLENLSSLKQPVMISYFIQNILSDHNYLISKKNMVFMGKQYNDPDIAVQSLYDTFRVQDCIWGKTAYSPVFLKDYEFRNTKCDSYILDVCFQKSLEKYGCDVGLAVLFEPCLWDITAEGLRRNDEFLSKFLFYRAFIIMIHFMISARYGKTREIYIERVSSLVASAMKIAGNNNNISLLHYFESMLEKFECIYDIEYCVKTMTDEKIKKIVELEKNMPFGRLIYYLTERDTKKSVKKKSLKRKVDQPEHGLTESDVYQPDLF